MLRPTATDKQLFNVERITTTKVYENVIILATDKFEANEIAERDADTLEWLEGSEEVETEFSAFDEADQARITAMQADVRGILTRKE